MAYVVTIRGVEPPARFDGLSWTRWRLDESTLSSGPWVQIEDRALSPVDADPSEPASRDVTSESATLAQGWYRVTFVDATGDVFVMPPVPNTLAEDYRPSVAEVASLVRIRTVDTAGEYANTFTTQTRPTAEQVEDLIALETGIVLASTGPLSALPCPSASNVRDAARGVIAKRVAANVEASFRPEDMGAGGDRTAAEFYQGDARADLAVITEAAQVCAVWTPSTPPEGGSAMAAQYRFPPAVAYGRW